MQDDDKNKLNEILAKLDDGSEIVAQIENAQLSDPMDSLRSALFDFFKSRLEKVEEQDIFQQAIKKSLMAKMEDGDVSVGQMIHLYSMLNTESTLKVDSLINVARARDQAVVPLVVQNPNQTPDNYQITDPVQRATLDELKTYIRGVLAEEEEKKRLEEKGEE